MVRALIRKIVDSVAEGQKYHIEVVFSDGSSYHSTRLGNPDVKIIFLRRTAELRMVFGGMFEFMEAYFNGDIDIVGEHGLRKLVNLGYQKPFGRIEHPLTFIKRRLLEWRQNNADLAQAKLNATYHYGLPTEFFHLVLGDTYGYTEGCWQEDTLTLEQAQHNNFDLICQKLRLNPGDKLVEIGPGWGYMAMLAAQKYGAKVTCYGLVKNQNDGMRTLMNARGFQGDITLVEKDHRELENEPEAYDRYVSIGVHEHAGCNCNEQWIKSIATSLRPGGIGLISATFNMRKRPTNYCTIKHIFPGGYIPSLAETLILMEEYGLDVRAIENRSYHYHRTVEQWLKNLETRWTQIQALDPERFNEKFRRTWLFYLGGAAETFEAVQEIINCYHITFVKGHFARRGRSVPLDRLR
ncbi:class I SAM-dependent methyltransferase [Uliginosibacterium gangwonense]|uniref:class I SAM-dependent methyltransferase n=1 Tax=Uliginosibacterium gangwonense TaxID=392736 RepID=UPI00035DD129|nr:class I SAM-dependent methyltransferase [Uliginosibacterium gangwonense]